MNPNTKIAKESAISFTGMGFGQLLRYLFTTLLARWAGVELLGIYSLANAVTRISEVIAKLGLDQGILRKVSREDNLESKQAAILSALKMGLISGLIFMLIQIAFSGYLAEDIFNQSSLLTKVIAIHAFSLPFYIIIHISSFSTQAFKLLKYKIVVTEIQNPFILLLAMIVCYFFYSAESAIIIPVVLSAVLGCITITIFLKKVSGINILSVKRGMFNRDLLNYSLPIMFMSILGTVLHWTDVIMLGYITDPETVGLYHPAARTAGIVRIILLSFAGIYGPLMAEMYAKKQNLEMNHLFKLVTRWITTFSLPFAILILLFPQKIMLIFGSQFLQGYPILMILVSAAFIQAVFGIGGTTLNMTGFPKMNLLNTFIACGLNISFNFYLIPTMGGMGAATATLITLSFIAFIRIIQNWKLLQLTPWSPNLIKPISAGILAFAVGYYLKELIMPFHTILTLISGGLIIVFVFFTTLWLFGLDEDDAGLLAGIQIILGNFKSKSTGKK
ncbi:MAG TPA: flippase [Candidatus Marinimicrobia bacterium]|nr:flippase [Candidatus Neomarinimicrobiota bacterium]